MAVRAAFMVHGWPQARAACAAASGAGAALTLVSAPNCASTAGVGWFQALVDKARVDYPDLDIVGVLLCGDAAGRALQAMAHGVRHLVVDPNCPALERLRDIASQRGACLMTAPPDSANLGLTADPDAASRAALGLPS